MGHGGVLGDLADDYKAMSEAKKQRREKRIDDNIKILYGPTCKIKFELRKNENLLLFREQGKPKVDFYLGTGRWRSKNKTYKGGAKSFLIWYSKQNL